MMWQALTGRSLLPIVVAVSVGCLLTLPWEQDVFKVLVRDTTRLTEWDHLATDVFTRESFNFTSQGIQCDAWLYLPAASALRGSTRPPIIVMAHGLGAQRDMGLQRYAEVFVASGYAVVTFDYRHYGGSDGEPRQLASPKKQLQDWAAAVEFIRATALDGRVDPSRLALWGVSFSGGHVLSLAAQLGDNVTAVVANEPHLTSDIQMVKGTVARGALPWLRLLLVATSDVLRSALGLSPAYVKLLGEHGELAMLTVTQEEYLASRMRNAATHRHLGGWQNIIAARVVFEVLGYHPLWSVHRITAPVILRMAKRDLLCPSDTIRKAAALLGNRTVVVERDVDHLSAHIEGAKPEAIQPVLEFLARYLQPEAGAGVAAAAAAAEGGAVEEEDVAFV